MRTYGKARHLGGRLSVRRWSLRSRLLIGVVALAAVGLAVTGSVGTALLRSYLVQQVDEQLVVGEVALSGPLIGPMPGPLPANAPTQLPTPYLFTELDANGAVVQRFGGPSPNSARIPDLSGLDAARVRMEAGKAFTVPAVDGGSGFRVRAVERSDGSGAGAVAVSLQSVDAAVHRLELITWLVALGVLAGLMVLGSLVVRVALRPLDAVERTAEEISVGDLSRRVPLGRPGTEIGRLSATLNGMLAKIESAFHAREQSETTLRQFVADASHELRTPLTTIRGYAELARKGAFEDARTHERAMVRLESEAARMGGLVDDLLLLADLDQQRPLNVTQVDLATLVTDGVADARARDPKRPIDVTVSDSPVEVVVDADRFRQVIANLLGNALIHTAPGTPVHVSLESGPGMARLVVSDEGPGLACEHLPRLFERFYRADPSRTRARGGSGLGLAIVHAVVIACRGTVTVTSEDGTGTAFVITLPMLGGTHSQ